MQIEIRGFQTEGKSLIAQIIGKTLIDLDLNVIINDQDAALYEGNEFYDALYDVKYGLSGPIVVMTELDQRFAPAWVGRVSELVERDFTPEYDDEVVMEMAAEWESSSNSNASRNPLHR
jgi:hypothetical protein